MKKPSKSFEFDYEEVKNKALEQLKTGSPLLGKGGALAPLFKSFLEAALEAELENHLQDPPLDAHVVVYTHVATFEYRPVVFYVLRMEFVAVFFSDIAAFRMLHHYML